MPSEQRIVVNGSARDLRGDPARKLLSVLRDELDLTGSKYGCGEGSCGACTVLLDGRPVFACQTTVGEVGGRRVTTIEGIATGDRLSRVQRAFLEAGAFQCGFCTPGMVVRATALLEANPHPTPDQVRGWMEPNLCRCGGYGAILRAIDRAAAMPSDEPSETP